MGYYDFIEGPVPDIRDDMGTIIDMIRDIEAQVGLPWTAWPVQFEGNPFGAQSHHRAHMAVNVNGISRGYLKDSIEGMRTEAGVAAFDWSRTRIPLDQTEWEASRTKGGISLNAILFLKQAAGRLDRGGTAVKNQGNSTPVRHLRGGLSPESWSIGTTIMVNSGEVGPGEWEVAFGDTAHLRCEAVARKIKTLNSFTGIITSSTFLTIDYLMFKVQQGEVTEAGGAGEDFLDGYSAMIDSAAGRHVDYPMEAANLDKIGVWPGTSEVTRMYFDLTHNATLITEDAPEGVEVEIDPPVIGSMAEDPETDADLAVSGVFSLYSPIHYVVSESLKSANIMSLVPDPPDPVDDGGINITSSRLDAAIRATPRGFHDWIYWLEPFIPAGFPQSLIP